MNAGTWLHQAIMPDSFRLDAFRKAHPDVRVHGIYCGHEAEPTAWQASWDEGSYGTVITRYTLRELLAALERILPSG